MLVGMCREEVGAESALEELPEARNENTVPLSQTSLNQTAKSHPINAQACAFMPTGFEMSYADSLNQNSKKRSNRCKCEEFVWSPPPPLMAGYICKGSASNL